VCGNRPVLRQGELRACRDRDPQPHRCPRTFLFLGGAMLVFGTPA
jgi:hypothetical protein